MSTGIEASHIAPSTPWHPSSQPIDNFHGNSNRSPGWMAQLLPEVLFTVGPTNPQTSRADVNPFREFVSVLEDFWETLLQPIDNLQYYLDPIMTGHDVAQWLGTWVGADMQLLHPNTVSGSVSHRERTAAVVHQFGRSLSYRGTSRWYRDILQELTGFAVRIEESGGISDPEDANAVVDPFVHVYLESTGELELDAIRAFLRREIPVGMRLLLTIGEDPEEELQ